MKTVNHSNRLMFWMFICLLAFTATFLLTTNVQAKPLSTDVSGIIATNTTWTLAGNPYIVTSNIRVNSGVTLTVEPGVEVKFDNGKGIQVDGTLIAQGTSTDRITFTANQTPPSAGAWQYINFTSTSISATFDANDNYVSGSILQYCNILYGGGGVPGAVHIQNTSPFISNCQISNNRGTGIYATNPSNLHVSNNTISNNVGIASAYDNTAGGIYILGGSATIVTNIISNNSVDKGDGGVSLINLLGATLIRGNTITENSANGIDTGVGGVKVQGNTATVTLSDNTINNNSGGGGLKIRWSNAYILIDKNTISNNIDRGGNAAGVDVVGGSGYIDLANNIISNNQGRGVRVNESNNLTISRNIIYSSTGSGVYIDNPSRNITISNNMISSNGEYGVAVKYGYTITLTNNIIASNVKEGLRLGITETPSWMEGGSGLVEHNTILRNGLTRAIFLNNGNWILTNNNIANISSYMLYYSGENGTSLNAVNNWWNTTSDATIQAQIYDWNDDGSTGVVNYVPFLTSPDTSAPISPPNGTAILFGLNGTATISWSANPESDVAGYKVYYDTDQGYPYAHVIDVGNVTSATLSALSRNVNYIAVTAYDTTADGVYDLTDGNESWFSSEVTADLTPPTVQLNQAAFAVAEAASQVDITAILNKPYDQIVTVTYATNNGTATAGSDYTATSGTLTFTPGQTSQTFTIPISNDALDELNETVNLMLSNPISATLGTPTSAVLTITDDDAPPVIQFSTSTFTVGEASGLATITATLNTSSELPVTVSYATSNGTATAGSDYTHLSSALTFSPGETSKSFTIPITVDTLDENNESVNLALSSPTNATLGTPNSATLTIIDDDAPPSVQLNNATVRVNEGNDTAPINVTLSQPSGLSITVAYATSNGTAIAGSDYTAINGTVTFAPGETTRTLNIPITDDNILLEPDETFSVALSNPTNAIAGEPTSATLTIADNDVNDPSAQVNVPADPSQLVTVSIITPIGTSQVTFEDVRSSGTITILVSSTPPSPSPSNFTLLAKGFEVTTAGIDFGKATIRFPYRETDVVAAGVPEASLRLLHLENGQWKDITTNLDTTANIITGVTEHFSPFALGVQTMQDCAISLNSGAAYTGRLDVQVFSNMPGAAEMLVSNDAGFTGAQWQPYQSARNWTITDAENRIVTLLVYTRLRAANGSLLCSGLSMSDDIIYDPLSPTVTVQPLQNLTFSRQTLGSFTLQLSAADQPGGSGVASMQISADANFTSARWQTFAPTAQVTAQSGDQLYVRVRDGVGNLSNAARVIVPGQGANSVFLPLIVR